MHQFSENLFQNAIDLNDTIVFEYNAVDDVITFSDNIKKYSPIPVRLSAFVEKIGYLGKVYDGDIEKAISFFTLNETQVWPRPWPSNPWPAPLMPTSPVSNSLPTCCPPTSSAR